MTQQPFQLQRDGMTLRGMTYQPRPDRRQPTVVLLHGFTGSRMESGFLFVHLARALSAQGIAAVTFDFMHSGESDGSFDQMRVSGEIADALHVTDWVQRQPFVDRSRLGLLGFSLGGLVAGCVMGRSPAYRALTLLAPTTSENLSRFGKRADDDESVTVGPHTLHPDFFDDLMQIDAPQEVAQRPVPTLLVQGTADTAVSPDVSQVYDTAIRGAGGELRRLDIAQADHGFSQPAWRARLVPGVVRFLSEQLS